MGYIDETEEKNKTVDRLIRFMKAVENPGWMVELVEGMNNKIKMYESLEEQGKMPCVAGDKIIRNLEGIKTCESLHRDVSCMAAVTKILQETSEDICNNYCRYRETTDEESLCDILRNGGSCPLDRLI